MQRGGGGDNGGTTMTSAVRERRVALSAVAVKCCDYLPALTDCGRFVTGDSKLRLDSIDHLPPALLVIEVSSSSVTHFYWGTDVSPTDVDVGVVECGLYAIVCVGETSDIVGVTSVGETSCRRNVRILPYTHRQPVELSPRKRGTSYFHTL